MEEVRALPLAGLPFHIPPASPQPPGKINLDLRLHMAFDLRT